MNGNSTAIENTPTSMNNSTTSHMSSTSSSADSTNSPSHRRALLPPSSPQLFSPTIASDETPPPIPRRFKPSLPPKPDSPAKSPTHKFANLSVVDGDVEHF